MTTISRTPGVVITDGNERAALAVARSLGNQGIPVFVGAEAPASLAGASRYCTQSFQYPSPWREPEAFVSCLNDAAIKWGGAAIFPMTDIAMEVIGEHRLTIDRSIAVPIPALEQYHRLSDKYGLTKWARENDIPVPQTLFVPDGRIEDLVAQIDSWPVVVKPARSLLKLDGYWQKSVVKIAPHADELRRLYHENWYLQEPSMLQDYVAGQGEGVFGLFEDGNPATLFAHRRLRERPPTGGVSVLREAIALPQPMTDYAVRIMREARWDGVAMVEFKVDERSGVPYLMEVNGRFWGSLQLAVDAGADFPAMLYNHATSKTEQSEQAPYRVGTRSQWWLGDVDHLLARLRHRDAENSLPKSTPSPWTSFLGLINIFDFSTRNEVFRLSDISPGLFELGGYASRAVRAAGRKLRYRAARWQRAFSYGAADLGLRLGIHRKYLRARIPSSAERILILCKGNICRSPFAEIYLRQAAQRENLRLSISSAGLDAASGIAAYPIARTVAPRFGVNLDEHLTSALSEALVQKADIILVMEPDQIAALRHRFPCAEPKAFLLGHFAAERPMTEIKDPYGGTQSEFEDCYAILAAACEGFLLHLRKVTPRSRSSS